MNNIQEITNIIKSILDDRNTHYEFNLEESNFKFTFPLSGQISSCRMRIFVREEYIASYANFPFRPDETMRLKTAEYFTRINYNLKMGNFELDFSDGEIRYKITYDYSQNIPSEETLKQIVLTPPAMLQKYCESLLYMLYTDSSPSEALIRAEAEYNAAASGRA